MDPACSLTREALCSRVTELEAALQEQEQNVIKAAMFGKSLLEENADLRHRIEELMKQQATALEEKQQEVCSLQSRTEIAAHTEQWQQDEISNLRTELHNLHQNITQQVEEEKAREITAYKKQVESLRLEVDNLQAQEQELRGHNAELDALLQTHLDRTQIQSISTSFTSEQMAVLTDELSTLKMDLTEAQAKNIELSGKLQQVLREKDMLTNKLKSVALEIEDLQCQIISYSKHLEESKKEVLELRAQLDAARVDSEVHSSKGNSLFSELEDRRQVLEKMMVSLKVQNQQLKEKYDIEKQQNHKYKMQIAVALQMSSHKEDPTVQRLRDQLKEAHSEIRTLVDQVQNLETAEGSLAVQMASGDLLEKVEDRNYTQYLLTIIKTEKEKAAKSRAELQSKSLQYLDVTGQNVKLMQQSKQLQEERDKLQSQLIKATIQKEELLLKHEPDKVKSGKVQKRVVEKIEMGDAQSQMREKITSASCRSSDIFKTCPSAGRQSDIFKASTTTGQSSHLFKPDSSTGRPSNVLKPVTATGQISNIHQSVKQQLPEKPHILSLSEEEDSLFYSDKENFIDSTLDLDPSFALPQGRKVGMADDVKVIEADGKETLTVLRQESDKTVPSGAMSRKKQPKPLKKVKYVSADEAPQYDCKTQ